MPLEQLDQDLWVASTSLRFGGLDVGARMAVVRLPGGELVVISPIAAEPQLVDEVAQLGPVEALIAPNKLHHLFIGDWKQRFPGASLHVAPGLETKRSDLPIDSVLTSTAKPAWAEVIDQEAVDGFPFANEVVFFHRPTATLVVADLAFHVTQHSPAATKWAFRLLGAYNKVAITPLERFLIRDRAGFRRSIERVLSWPFERLVVAHGAVVETDARSQFESAYAWLLRR